MTELTGIVLAEALLQLSMIMMIGLYFTFSNTVMKVLSNSRHGAAIMIDINKQILNPLFLACFIISGVAGAYFFWSETGVRSIAGAIFLLGTTLVTVLFNVPLNNRLRDANSVRQPVVWNAYLSRWVWWNHIRSLTGILSGFLLSV